MPPPYIEGDIFNENYHDKYRECINEKRYPEYIELVTLDMYTKLFDEKLKTKIEKLFKEKFGKENFVINGLPDTSQDQA